MAHSKMRYEAMKIDAILKHLGQPDKPYDYIVAWASSFDPLAFAIDRDHDVVYGSGDNCCGQLGTGNRESINNGFKKIANLSGRMIIHIAIGSSHTLFLTLDGKVLACGANYFGQVGIGTSWEYVLTPQFVKFPEGIKIKSIRTGSSCSWALSRDGRVFEWGWRNKKSTPQLVDTEAIGQVKEIYACSETAFALTESNKLYSWGKNSQGQCGIGGRTPIPHISSVDEPTLVRLEYDRIKIKQVICGENIAAILTEANDVYMWGAILTKIVHVYMWGLIRIQGDVEWTSTPTLVKVKEGKQIQALLEDVDRIIVVYNDNSVTVCNSGKEQPYDCSSCDEVFKERVERVEWSKVVDKPLFVDVSNHFNHQEPIESSVKFKVDNKIIHAQKSILIERNEVFESNFSGKWKDKDEIDIDFCGYEAFHSFLFYFYSARVETDSLGLFGAVELYDIANKYLEPYLKDETKKAVWLKTIATTSTDELIEAYHRARGHRGLLKKILQQIKKIPVTRDNFLRIAKLAHDIKDESLFTRAFTQTCGMFVRQLFTDDWDPEFIDGLISRCSPTSNKRRKYDKQ